MYFRQYWYGVTMSFRSTVCRYGVIAICLNWSVKTGESLTLNTSQLATLQFSELYEDSIHDSEISLGC